MCVLEGAGGTRGERGEGGAAGPPGAAGERGARGKRGKRVTLHPHLHPAPPLPSYPDLLLVACAREASRRMKIVPSFFSRVDVDLVVQVTTDSSIGTLRCDRRDAGSRSAQRELQVNVRSLSADLLL